ncbi:hypothetical protein FPQ18DRAFT_315313 [Pyronema domesticum]|uniref:Lccl domain-containing protein n=1 Tax=Pyronema omphalodes (strain CBS 100304) TaxID=1076935 RepID=U4LF35_PYROM|nr:hypothetical protein FPQ18DRAFT_315313 [Pyronema domesticum]CCX30157.1 Similar to predicted protein [Laccaria bicolor S238N-H82]; acc. no. XP_001873957 [Pyronema omphalodes CBS 100304]
MAAPKDMTTLDITGRWIMNKTLSEDTSEILTLQNVRWMTRTAIGLATITLDIKHFKDKEGVEHIDIQQTMTGGIKGTEEKRTLDSVERGHKDHIFGNVVGKTKRCKVEEVEDEYLKTGWETAMVEEGVIDSYVVNKEVDWVAHQIWGFEIINGEKRYVRHVRFEKKGNNAKVITRKLVYDYIGPIPE